MKGKIVAGEKAEQKEPRPATWIGSFDKFVFPMIRRVFPRLIDDEVKETPLQELAERAFAEHDPTDSDWKESTTPS